MNPLKTSLILLACSALTAGASDMAALLDQMGVTDFEARQSARNDLYTHAVETAGNGSPEALLELETSLVAALSSESLDRDAKIFAARLLTLAGTPGAANGIYAATRAPAQDAILKDHLIQALSALPGTEVSQLLLEGLAGAPDDELAAWWQAIARQAGPDSVPAIVSIIESGGLALSPEATAALGKLGGPAAAQFLFAKWEGAAADTRTDIEIALLDTTGCEMAQLQALLAGSENPPTRLGAFGQIMDQSSETALDILAGMLSNDPATDDSAFIAAALATGADAPWELLLNNLDRLDDREKAVLIGAIADQEKYDLEGTVLNLAMAGSADVQTVALRALPVIAGEASVPFLSELLLSEDEDLQALAAYALSTVVDPELDRQIKKIASDAEHPSRRQYLELMAIRNNDGAVAMLNALLREEMNSPATGDILSAIEQIGDLDSVRILLQAIASDSPDLPTRKLQLSLKRLSIRLAIADYLWEELYLPAIEAAPDSASQARIVEILDGLSSKGAMDYVTDLYDSSEDPERLKAASSTMRRWTDLNIGDYWLGVAKSFDSSSDEIRAAKAALIRLITSDNVDGNDRDKARFALEVVVSLRDDAIKQDILDAVLAERSVKSPFLNNLKPYRFIIEYADKAGDEITESED